MCNGDLGMYRVMPWAYPTISGGSSGGSSVDPTPEPAVDPYDFSGISATLNRSTTIVQETESRWRAKFSVKLSGIKVINTSNVNFVAVVANLSGVTITPSSWGTNGSDIRIPDANDPNVDGYIVYDYYTEPASSSASITGSVTLTIKVVGVDGEIIQTHELVIP